MKKSFLTFLTLAASCAFAPIWAQGFIYFNNAANTKVSTNSAPGGAATGPISANAGTTSTTYYFALFVSSTAPSSTAPIVGSSDTQTYAFQNISGWTFDNPTTTTGYIGPAYATNNILAGQFNSTVADPNQSGGTLLATSAPQYFVVIGWSASIGSTLQDLEAWYENPTVYGLVGQSQASGLLTPGSGGLSSPIAVFGTGTGEIPGFVLGPYATPEPGPMALIAAGGALLFVLRRGKSGEQNRKAETKKAETACVQ